MKKKIITEKELPIVEDVLAKWSGKLTWPAFAEALAKRLNRGSISTFTLMGDDGIKQAFKRRKQTLKDKPQVMTETGDVTIDALLKENAELKGQIEHLKAEHSVKEKNLERDIYSLAIQPISNAQCRYVQATAKDE